MKCGPFRRLFRLSIIARIVNNRRVRVICAACRRRDARQRESMMAKQNDGAFAGAAMEWRP
jgi:hypothetical protein